MRKFKYKDNIFGFFANKYIREEDTYKDANGKGLIQRFVEVCGEYLDDYVNPELDNFLDIINPNVTDDYFINLLWEYFGFIPYAYGIIQNSKYYDKVEISQALNRKNLNVDYRNLLRYAISLYKIRCTPTFYTILGRFYGLEITMTEPSGDQINKSSVYDSEAYYDQSSYYNQEVDCLECLDLTANVKFLNTQAIPEPKLTQMKEGVVFLLNKYLPLHVKEFTTSSINFTTAV